VLPATTGPEYRADVSTAISHQTIEAPGAGLLESVAAAFRAFVADGLGTRGDEERRAAARAAIEDLADVLAPAVVAAEDEIGVSDALGEVIDDPESVLALLRCLQTLVAFAPTDPPSEPLTRDMMSGIFGETPDLGDTLMRERIRFRVLQRMPKAARDAKRALVRAESPTGPKTPGFLAGLANPGLSPRVVRVRYQMAIGDVALLTAACLGATGRAVPAERRRDLFVVYDRGLYAWLRWHTAFFPDDIPESVVPQQDRFDKPTEDARAAAREAAIRAATAEAARTGQATIVFPEGGGGHGGDARPR
jgi:hypothetical protein